MVNVEPSRSGAAAVVAIVALACAEPGLPAQTNTAQALSEAAGKSRGSQSGDLFFQHERHLLYVTLPGSLEFSGYRNGLGIVVLDVDDGYSFVKRIPTWDVAASRGVHQISGVTASPITNLLYLSARDRLAAFDLATDKMVWQNAYDGQCCERPQITPDGKTLVVGSNLKDFWYVIDPLTGKLSGTIRTPLTSAAHNTNLSPDGKLVFMSSTRSKVLSIGEIATKRVVGSVTFDDGVRPFVLNHDASLLYANVNNLLGFDVADVKSGRVIKRVELPGFGWKEKWNDPRRGHTPHNCPSHGIALTPDEKEVWIVDQLNNYIHIFDNAKEDPVLVESIKTSSWPLWITMGLDGTYAYVSSGDIIDVKSRKIIAHMKDEYGRQMASEKLLDMTFVDGRLQRVSNQFANGMSSLQAAR